MKPTSALRSVCTGVLCLFSFLSLMAPQVRSEIPLAATVEFENHYYYLVVPAAGITWDQAQAAAASEFVTLPDGTVLFGHLVTITSQAEQDFVRSSFVAGDYQQLWLGAFQFSSETEPAGNWAWVTGEEIGDPTTDWAYQFLATGQPGDDPTMFCSESALRMLVDVGGPGAWEDFPYLASGPGGGYLRYVIEFDEFGDNFIGLKDPPAVVSGSHWRTSDVAVPGWQMLGFDDSTWPSARCPYPNPNDPGDQIPGTNGNYIWHDPMGTSDGTTGPLEAFFRYTFHLALPTELPLLVAQAQVTVDDDYDLFVNGQLAFENHDNGHAEVVDAIDLTPYLQNGENVIAIHAVDGIWGQPFDRAFESLLFDLQLDMEPGVFTFDFQTSTDLSTPLVNGQAVDPNMSLAGLVKISTSAGGFDAGPAIFCSDPNGPNALGPDKDLLVGLGQLLIRQQPFSVPVNGIFPQPNDSPGFGFLVFEYQQSVKVLSLDLVDIDAPDQDAGVLLFDVNGKRRGYSVPSGWTRDIKDEGPPGYGTLDLTTLAPQPGYQSTATVTVNDRGFLSDQVVLMTVFSEGSAAVDNIKVRPTAPVVVKRGMTLQGMGIKP